MGCIQSSLFWINFWCWRGLVRSVVMRRRGAVNDRQAMKVPRLERGERSGLVQLISNELIQWSQTGRDTNNNISHHTPSHHHTITSHHSLNSIWKFVAGCFPVRRESVNNNKQRESSSALRSGLGREKIFKIFLIFPHWFSLFLNFVFRQETSGVERLRWLSEWHDQLQSWK